LLQNTLLRKSKGKFVLVGPIVLYCGEEVQLQFFFIFNSVLDIS